MPSYVFECPECNDSFERVMGMHEDRSAILSSCCGLVSERIFTPVSVGVFKPYTENNFNGRPIEITSSKQRDALCEEHGLSYDSTRYNRKPQEKAAVEDVTLGDVKEAIETGRLPDGSKLEPPTT